MLKKLMVALDGSENAERALWWATEVAGREKALVVLFRAVDTSILDPEFIPSNVADARNYLQRMEAEINQAGLPAKVVVRQGTPAEAIVEAATEERCDLILMTTRDGFGVKRRTIGGVTEQVLRKSPIPVLPVRSRTRPARNGHVRRVIVPVDGSGPAERANGWAAGLARMLKARLVFLHVYPGGPGGLGLPAEETFEALRERTVRLCRLLAKGGQKARFAVRSGDAARRILGFSRKNDLIVTASRGQGGGFKRWIFGSVAEKLVHEARVPVLVYKTFSRVKGKVRTA